MEMNEDGDIIAEGPDSLYQVLQELLAKSKADKSFASAEHYVMYQLGSQRSLIRVETASLPFKFWHYDLMGRPVTVAVKDTIARFLLEECGVKME